MQCHIVAASIPRQCEHQLGRGLAAQQGRCFKKIQAFKWYQVDGIQLVVGLNAA